MNNVLAEDKVLVHETARSPKELQAKMRAAGAVEVVSITYSGKHSAYFLVKAAPAAPAAAKAPAEPAADEGAADGEEKKTRRTQR